MSVGRSNGYIKEGAINVPREKGAIEPKEEETSAANKPGRHTKDMRGKKDEKEPKRRTLVSKQNRYCWKIAYLCGLEGKSAMLTS
jgi:hypothetical protein